MLYWVCVFEWLLYLLFLRLRAFLDMSVGYDIPRSVVPRLVTPKMNAKEHILMAFLSMMEHCSTHGGRTHHMSITDIYSVRTLKVIFPLRIVT